jgi:hypothetical protein
VRWSELPGWDGDRLGDFWSALLRSCERPAPAGSTPARKARQLGATRRRRGDARVAAAAASPYRVESLDRDPVGLATGYFEPLVEASRVSRPGFRVALYGPPADLASRSPYWTRQQLETLPAAQKSLQGREIAWVRDRLDALLLQVQGSGRLVFASERGGAPTIVRVAYAAHNDQPYRSVGRWLIEQGELRASDASWPAIRAWARQNPAASTRCCAATRASSSSARSRCPIPASARRARKACRSRRAARSRSTRRASRTARRSGSTPPSRSRPGRCAASSSPRTPARRSSAPCAPTTSGAGATMPRPPPGE